MACLQQVQSLHWINWSPDIASVAYGNAIPWFRLLSCDTLVMPSSPMPTMCKVAGVSVKKWGEVMHCPNCGQRTTCRYKMKRHLDSQSRSPSGKIRCTSALAPPNGARRSRDRHHQQVAVEVDPPGASSPPPGGAWTPGDVAAMLLDGFCNDQVMPTDQDCPPVNGDPGQCLDAVPCDGASEPEEVPPDVRARGGVDREDPVDAAEFFNQYGLPNLLSDDDIDDEDVDVANVGEAGWPVHQVLRPLYPGSHYTVQQYAYALFKIKTGSIRDDRADQLCKLLAEIMPEGFEGPKCDPRLYINS